MRGVALAAALAVAFPSGAQSTSCARLDALPTTPAQGWAPPLDRPVTIAARDVALRDVLDRLAATAAVRLSYSPDLLPLERRVCVDFDGVALGGALSELLAGTGVEARVVSPEQVALAPLPGRDAVAASTRTAVLEQVVVTGSAAGAPERALSIGLTVLGGAELRRRSTTGTTSELFDGAVPGVWLWDQPPTTLLARYASIRGASSFGITYPKVYIDGIEMASPLLVSRLDPEMIERVEVIRGPQGAALYGTDAISGVVNIVTRTAGASVGAPRLSGHASFGVASSDFVARPPVTQEYGAAFRAGSSVRAFTLGVTAGGAGAWIPGAWDRHLGATASTRVVGTKTIVTGTARLQLADALSTVSPVLAPLFDSLPRANRETVNQYTIGTNVRVMQSERVTHTLVLGVDGYRLTGVGFEMTPIPSAADSALRAANGAADRATLRVGTVIGLGNDLLSTTVTVGAEESVLRSVSTTPSLRPPPNASYPAPGAGAPSFRHMGGQSSGSGSGGSDDHGSWNDAAWRSNTGLIAQGTTALAGKVYLTGGVRLEQNAGFLGGPRWTALPMGGLSLVGGTERVMVKVRGAYGKGIRPARTASREIASGRDGNTDIERLNLPPETQSGVEAGADVYVGRAFAMRLTLFDQTASHLIQPVATSYGGSGQYGRGYYELQDVGRIFNRGMEVEGSVVHGPLALSASLATVSSVVNSIASGYQGDLLEGARVLEVPRLTLGANVAWNAARWSATVGLARAADWVGYDRFAIADAVLHDTSSVPLRPDQIGALLRAHWVVYSGVTHLRASVSRDIGRGYSVILAGDNLLNVQTGEPDNITVVPGRTVRAGVRTTF